MNLEAYMGEAALTRKVYLHGYLGDLFGKEFDLAVRSPAEAVRLLEANFPRKFQEAVKKGTFQIIVAGVKYGMQCSLEMIHFMFPKGSIHFIPIPEGSSGGGASHSKGLIMTIIGAALIATAFIGAAFLTGGVSLGAGLGTAIFGGVTWGQVGLLGVAVLLLGVSILLTPNPAATPPDTFQSFFYSGAVNSDKEGVPVPICYGRVWAGSVVIAGGIFDNKFAIQDNPVSYPAFTTSDNAGQPILEGTVTDVQPDNSDVLLPTGVIQRTDPPTPVGGTK